MGALSKFIMSNINDSMIPVLRGPVEEIANEILDRKGIPDRAEFREFRNVADGIETSLRRVERQFDEARAALRSLEDQVVAAEGAADAARAAAATATAAAARARASGEGAPGPAPRAAAAAPRAGRRAAPASAGERIRAAVSAATPAAAVAPAGREAEEEPRRPGRKRIEGECNVPGCGRPVRSKGFCGKHYQSWRRNSLADIGFPFPG